MLNSAFTKVPAACHCKHKQMYGGGIVASPTTMGCIQNVPLKRCFPHNLYNDSVTEEFKNTYWIAS